MSHVYDLTQPRISISQVNAETCEVSKRELGQATAIAEAMFFLTLGYTVHIDEWDGSKFVNRCNYLPEDL